MSDRDGWRLGDDGHPADEDVIAYLDGEVTADQREVLRVHFEACWTCRGRMRAIEQSIEEFLGARRLLAPPAPPPGHANALFRRRLSAEAAHDRAPHSWSRSVNELRSRVSVGWLTPRTAGLAAIVLGGLVLWLLPLSTSISAHALLARADEAERTVAADPAHALRATTRIEAVEAGRTRLLARVDMVGHAASGRHAVIVRAADGRTARKTSLHQPLEGDPQLAALVPDVLAATPAGAAWVPHLSVASYVAFVAGATDAVAVKMGSRVELRHVFSGAPVAEARLILNATTLEPERMVVTGTRQREPFEIVLTRDFFAHLALSAATELLDSPATPAMSSDADGVSPRVNRRARPLDWSSAPASSDEVSIARVLHDAGACLGEEVNVFPMSDGTVLVQGLVDTHERRRDLKDRLARNGPRTRIELYTPTDGLTGTELYDTPDRHERLLPQMAAGSTVSGATDMAMRHRIRDQLVTAGSDVGDMDRRVALFASETVTLSRETLLQAWALARHRREFAASRIADLSHDARDTVERLDREHVSAIGDATGRLAARLVRVGVPPPHNFREWSPPADVRNAQALLQAVLEQHRLVSALFSTTTPAQVASDEALARLGELLERMGK